MLHGLSDEMRQKYYKLDLHFPLKSNALIVRLATNQSTTLSGSGFFLAKKT